MTSNTNPAERPVGGALEVDQAATLIDPRDSPQGTNGQRLIVPRRRRGRPNPLEAAAYEAAVEQFCDDIEKFASTLDFTVSARGYGYLLEGYGQITKDEIDLVEQLINDCRKSGDLPIDITCKHEARSFDNVEQIDDTTPEEQAEEVINYVHRSQWSYWPFSFWDDQEFFVQMLVEKKDLKGLFNPICEEFYIPICNAGGWSDLHTRAEMMTRFSEHEGEGRKPVLLYCGDFDPGGLKISDWLMSNVEELSEAVGWSPDNLIIDRFGLNYDYIIEHDLVWIDNLITGEGKDLASKNHKKHYESWVQDYLSKYGARKVEANALLNDLDAARELCRRAVLKYVPEDAPRDYAQKLIEPRKQMREEILRLIAEDRS